MTGTRSGNPDGAAETVGGEGDDLTAAVVRLLPTVSGRAHEIEGQRSTPADVVADLEDTGVFRMMRVRGLGGLEVPPRTVADVIERLAWADASTAWITLIGATASAFFGWLDPDTARRMLAERPGAAASCVFAPNGTARRAGDDTFRVSGHWGWNSGIGHSPWRQVGAVEVDEAGEPIVGPGGAPVLRLVFVPAGTGTVVDHWDTMGLRGTGSHDLVLDEDTVLSDHTFAVGATDHRHTGPYARLGITDLVQIGVAAFPLGVARRALDEFGERVRGKSRGMVQRWTVADSDEVQADVGRAATELAAARSFVDRAATQLWDSACSGDVDQAGSQALEMATAHGLRAALRVVDSVFGHAGATSMRLDDPLQRCFRDLHAVAGHVFYSAGADREIGRRRLGLDQT